MGGTTVPDYTEPKVEEKPAEKQVTFIDCKTPDNCGWHKEVDASGTHWVCSEPGCNHKLTVGAPAA